MNPSKEITLDTHTVADVEISVVEVVWPDGGRSFEVYRSSDDQCLTMEGAFDLIPTDDEIEQLLGAIACRHCGEPLPAASARCGFLGWIGDCCAAGRSEIEQVARLT